VVVELGALPVRVNVPQGFYCFFTGRERSFRHQSRSGETRTMATREPRKKAKVSPGGKIAAKMRSAANKLSDEQRDESMSFAMQVIYGKGKLASHAVRH
jgi:hypothetical protein